MVRPAIRVDNISMRRSQHQCRVAVEPQPVRANLLAVRRYIIDDPWRYRLPRAGWGQQWVRHYSDVILVDTRRGVVIQVIRGFYR